MRRHRRTTLEIAKPKIIDFFGNAAEKIYTTKNLEDIMISNRESWRIAESTSVSAFIEFLIAEMNMQEFEIKFPSSWTPKFARYTLGEVSTFDLLSSLRSDFYFSHYTAIYIHQLTEQVPKIIYMTWEQPQKGRPSHHPLVQKKIDWAFRQPPRTSNNIAILGDQQIFLLYGTGKLGVTKIKGPEGDEIRVSNIERTLIDIAVRPFYAGGVFEVLKAFRLATKKVSINKLSIMLKNLAYIYPYHQAIGFYLERSGAYKESSIEIFRNINKEYDFYLTYQMDKKDMAYSKEWRLYYPKGL
jgi:predicted transcriptional regulator of viral defense system